MPRVNFRQLTIDNCKDCVQRSRNTTHVAICGLDGATIVPEDVHNTLPSEYVCDLFVSRYPSTTTKLG